MTRITDKHIRELNGADNTGFIIENCIIDHIDFCSVAFMEDVTIQKCVINKIELLSTIFEKGFHLDNNVILGEFTFEAGGHNKEPISISGNVFHGFCHVFDCVFNAPMIVRNNIFVKGTDLLTKEGKGFDNCFAGGLSIANNLGRLDVW